MGGVASPGPASWGYKRRAPSPELRAPDPSLLLCLLDAREKGCSKVILSTHTVTPKPPDPQVWLSSFPSPSHLLLLAFLSTVHSDQEPDCRGPHRSSHAGFAACQLCDLRQVTEPL